MNTLRGNEKLDASSQVSCIEYMQAMYPSVTTDRCNSFVFIVNYLFFLVDDNHYLWEANGIDWNSTKSLILLGNE